MWTAWETLQQMACMIWLWVPQIPKKCAPPACRTSTTAPDTWATLSSRSRCTTLSSSMYVQGLLVLRVLGLWGPSFVPLSLERKKPWGTKYKSPWVSIVQNAWDQKWFEFQVLEYLQSTLWWYKMEPNINMNSLIIIYTSYTQPEGDCIPDIPTFLLNP